VIVEPNPESIAKGILQLARDPKKRNQAADNSKRLIKENYSIEIVGEQLLSIYRKSMSEKA